MPPPTPAPACSMHQCQEAVLEPVYNHAALPAHIICWAGKQCRRASFGVPTRSVAALQIAAQTWVSVRILRSIGARGAAQEPILALTSAHIICRTRALCWGTLFFALVGGAEHPRTFFVVLMHRKQSFRAFSTASGLQDPTQGAGPYPSLQERRCTPTWQGTF